MTKRAAIWFPAVRTNTGTDVFTERLVKGLNELGVRSEITWLPLRAEYAPWTVHIPKPPEWATVVHVSTWLHPRFIPRNLPVVATVHHAIHHPDAISYKGWLRSTYHKFWIAPLERRVMKRADKVIAVSQFVAETSKKTLVDVPIQVIYNGVNTNIFKPGTRARKPGEPFRLLYVGSWMARKGVDLLAPIMEELGHDFELYYTGGPAAEKDKRGIPTNMNDIGRLKSDIEVAETMQNAEALLFPSRSEGFGLVAAEAMGCGLPVFTTKGSSVAELLDHGKNGYVCERDNATDFASAIRQLAADESLLKILSVNARDTAEQRFSEAMMVKTHVQHCYTQLL